MNITFTASPGSHVCSLKGTFAGFYGPKIPFRSSEKLLSFKAPSGALEDITAAAGFTDCRARELSEVLHFGALSRALDAQPANHEYTSYADGPISPSHSMHSLDGPVKRSAKSDVVGPLCW